MLDTTKDANIDHWLLLENILQLFFFSNSELLFLIFFDRSLILCNNELLVDQLDLLQQN